MLSRSGTNLGRATIHFVEHWKMTFQMHNITPEVHASYHGKKRMMGVESVRGCYTCVVGERGWRLEMWESVSERARMLLKGVLCDIWIGL